MKKSPLRSQSLRYAVFGLLFGIVFPLATFPIAFYIDEDIHEPILIGFIFLIPIILPLIAWQAGKRQDKLDRMNGELERIVAERTRSIQSLLDVSGLGFLSFGEDYLVLPEYSKECENIFRRPALAGLPIDELLYAGEEARANFRRGLNLFFNGTSRAEVIFDLLDARVGFDDRMIRLQYRVINERRVMLILADDTENERLRRAVEKENELKDLLIRVIANRRSFAAFDRQMRAFFDAVRGGAGAVESLAYDLHTLKGDAGFFGFRETEAAAHDLENYVSDSVALGEAVKPASGLERLRKAFLNERGLLVKTFGRDWLREVESVEVPLREYARLERHVREHYPADEYLSDALAAQRRQPFSSLLARLPRLVQDLAGRMGKRVAPLKITGGETHVTGEEVERVAGTFSHLVRNMVDHGIEPPAEREAAGKRPEGRIEITIRETPGALTIAFRDDGRGLPLDGIEAAARRQGLIDDGRNPSAKELIAFIFRERFTTARTSSLVSGRGLGLAAVREAVRDAEGTITVKTTSGKGTEFTITLPARYAARKESAA